MSNALLLTQLLLQYTAKMQEVAQLFAQANAEGRDVTDAEIDASGLKADAAIERLKANAG